MPGLKVRALLADLLLHEGRVVSRDRLVEDLWGDEAPADPAAALYVRISQLRRVLEAAEPGGRDSCLPAARVRAEGRAGRGRRGAVHRPGGARPGRRRWRDGRRCSPRRWGCGAGRSSPTSPTAVHPRAVGTGRSGGSPPWKNTPRYGSRSASTGALAAELGELVAGHPFRERLRAAHMRALYRSGRTDEALDDYDGPARLLADELGLDPGPELVALHQAILRGDPGGTRRPRPRVRRRPATNLPAPVTELIGRDDAVAGARAAGRRAAGHADRPRRRRQDRVAVGRRRLPRRRVPGRRVARRLATWDRSGDAPSR